MRSLETFDRSTAIVKGLREKLVGYIIGKGEEQSRVWYTGEYSRRDCCVPAVPRIAVREPADSR